jgi:hypothetical protein
MATLRTAFMQTYHSTNPCLTFLSTLPCLLSSLLTTNDPAPTDDNGPAARKFAKVSCSFDKLNKLFRSDKDRFMWISALYTNSLHEIDDNNNSDFHAQQQDGSFVHALELINEEDLCPEMYDLKTVQSEVISIFGNDPNSTEISLSSDF